MTRRTIEWRDMGEIPYRASRLMRALSNPKAYALCRLLLERKEMDTSEMARQLGRSTAAVSKILRNLRDLNIVRYQKSGDRTWYTLKHPRQLRNLLSAAESFIREAERRLEQAM